MSDSNNPADSVATLTKLAVAAAGPEDTTLDGVAVPLYVIPNKYRLAVPNLSEMEPLLLRPLRKKGTFAFLDLDSFARYYKEHGNEDSRIFAALNDGGGQFRGALNFHGKESSFNDHVCLFNLVATREWGIWRNCSGKKFTQPEFACWLEDNQEMFTSPSGADLLELVTTLEGKANVSVKSAVRLQNQTMKLMYDEEVELKGGSNTQSGTIDIPTILTAGIAPFEGSAPYQVRARLKWKIADRKITFWYEAIDAHLVVREVCAALRTQMEKLTGQQVFRSA